MHIIDDCLLNFMTDGIVLIWSSKGQNHHPMRNWPFMTQRWFFTCFNLFFRSAVIRHEIAYNKNSNKNGHIPSTLCVSIQMQSDNPTRIDRAFVKNDTILILLKWLSHISMTLVTVVNHNKIWMLLVVVY